ncbi:MAG: hypothetical protein ABIP55_16305 [Tepidisphaeraceae bacterium]
MIKLILLLVALGVGFGGGVYWAHHNPDAAAKLAAEEEKRFLEAQLALTQKIKAKLDSLDSKTSAKSGASSFLSSGQASAAAKQDVSDLKQEHARLEEELRQRLNAQNAKLGSK